MKLILLISSLLISVTCDSEVGDDVIHQIDQAIMKGELGFADNSYFAKLL